MGFTFVVAAFATAFALAVAPVHTASPEVVDRPTCLAQSSSCSQRSPEKTAAMLTEGLPPGTTASASLLKGDPSGWVRQAVIMKDYYVPQAYVCAAVLGLSVPKCPGN